MLRARSPWRFWHEMLWASLNSGLYCSLYTPSMIQGLVDEDCTAAGEAGEDVGQTASQALAGPAGPVCVGGAAARQPRGRGRAARSDPQRALRPSRSCAKPSLPSAERSSLVARTAFARNALASDARSSLLPALTAAAAPEVEFSVAVRHDSSWFEHSRLESSQLESSRVESSHIESAATRQGRLHVA